MPVGSNLFESFWVFLPRPQPVPVHHVLLIRRGQRQTQHVQGLRVEATCEAVAQHAAQDAGQQHACPREA